nr:hypothetical protein [Tanacetum cinerariifolium]
MEPNSVLPYVPTKDDHLLDNITGYQKLLGKLIYLTHTRPDIDYYVYCLAQYMHSPLKSHLNSALNVLRYLKGAPVKSRTLYLYHLQRQSTDLFHLLPTIPVAYHATTSPSGFLTVSPSYLYNTNSVQPITHVAILLGFRIVQPERLKREYHSIRQANTETITEFMQRFLRLAGFLGTAAGTEEEHTKNFQWGLRRSTLNHLMCMSYTDVAQVANAARNYEILHERDDDDAERPDKRGSSEGYSYPVCTTCGRRHPGEYRRAAGTCFKCGQAGHLQKDCKKNTTASTSGQADKKPSASGRVFAITEDHATKTS